MIRCTVDERSIEPLHVVALWEGEQHLVGQNRDGEKEHSTHCDRQGERTQPQPRRRGKKRQAISVCLYLASALQYSLGERLVWIR